MFSPRTLLVGTIPSWRSTAMITAALLYFGTMASASIQANLRQPASVSYQSRSPCPALCGVSGPDPANWTSYNNLDQLRFCTEPVFYHVGLYDAVDDGSMPHRIYACTSLGMLSTPTSSSNRTVVQTIDNATFTLGRFAENAPQGVDLLALSKQMRLFLDAGSLAVSSNVPLVLFARTVSSTAGLYVGKGVATQPTVSDALVALENVLYTSNNTGGSLALQLCNKGYTSDHIVGFTAVSNISFTPVQQALRSWANATCLSFNSTQKITSKASFTTPLVLANSNGTVNGTVNGTSTLRRRHMILGDSDSRLTPRASCTTVKVVSGDSCSSLATKCGISPSAFTKYNPGSSFCADLVPGQHVCCSSGSLPDFAPKPNSDGTCYAYTIASDDTCSGLSAVYDLTNGKIEGFNKNTWGWSGCDLLFIGDVICLSTGNPPMPAALSNAVCGPQKPNTPAQDTSNMTAISWLNPCPLNACCDIWGQCGITEEFCNNTSLGPPGTAAKGSYGCISNCGTDVVQGDTPASFMSLTYYEGFSLGGRSCLFQDARQIDTKQYTHIHYSFGVLDSNNYRVSVGDVYAQYEFEAFKALTNVKRVLTIGGWAFSTDPSTYNIFREGVTAANRMTMAKNIADFVTSNDLDGIDIDWEYPGEPDIPGIPAGNKDDGTNFLAFLVVLKNLLPGKTVSIAAPSSYWYLKQFPIAQMANVVDYIVFMTYDLHGQWDAGNQYSQEGCPTGSCLRSHVNLTETMTALAMVTKAGVPSGKVVVGVSSYGRSFAMAEAGCHTADCLFTGTATQSNAEKGPCTVTAGYIGDAEIYAIISGDTNTTGNSKRDSSFVNQNYVDKASNSRILVYGDTQWVAYMDADIRSERASLYQGLSMGGSTNWASDLETYNPAPDTSTSWASFKEAVGVGGDPYAEGTRSGNWTSLTCSNPAVENALGMAPYERWDELDCDDAWNDILNVWQNHDKAKGWIFTESVANTIHVQENTDCGTLLDTSNCVQTITCQNVQGGSGPAGYEIWNSFVLIHEMYQSYSDSLTAAAADYLDAALKDFENQFAPIPPPPSDEWLDILLAIVDLVGVVGVSSVFNSILKDMPFWKTWPKGSYDNSKDTGKALVSFSTSLAGTLTGKGDDGSGWTVEQQDAFSAYMAQVVPAWKSIAEMQLKGLFDGSSGNLAYLTDLIANGQLIAGAAPGGGSPSAVVTSETQSSLEQGIAKALFASAIPTLWNLAGTYAFVLDTGMACGASGADGGYVQDIGATGGCYNGNQYYVVYPSGSSRNCVDGELGASCSDNSFSTPPGLSTLDGTRFGGVTLDDLIAGSLKTYAQNGNQNGGAATDPTNDGSVDDLINVDVTTPGFIRLPVCSGFVAFTAWDDAAITSTTANYPCVIKPSPNDCGDSTFIDQTSDGSPSVSDCQGIINNIQGTQGSWEVENAVETQHQIVQYGSCKFGVQGTSVNGNVDFHVGAQDIVDIITAAIQQYGGSGKVGAEGDTSCQGDVSNVPVHWGLY